MVVQQIDSQTYRKKDRSTAVQMNRQTNIRAKISIIKESQGQTTKQTDTWTDGHLDRHGHAS